MNKNQTTLVQNSFKQLMQQPQHAAELFYKRIFEIDPQLKLFFTGSNMEVQGQQLIQTLELAVSGLSNIDAIMPVIKELGEKHEEYGVTAEHFPIIADALFYMLERSLKSDWTVDVESAWADGYTLFATTMISSMKKADKANASFVGKLKRFFAA